MPLYLNYTVLRGEVKGKFLDTVGFFIKYKRKGPESVKSNVKCN